MTRNGLVVVGVVLALAVVVRPGLARAGNPANPILFVTQVPMPEEVNSRTVGQSNMSCVSPFSNHLADTAHAGRGGSLNVRFSNGQVMDLLSVANWSAIPGGKPAANTIAVRNPNVNWAADRAIFSMVAGAPTGPADTTTFLWQLYEITLPTQAELNASVKPVITKVANQPAWNNVFPAYALAGKILFASDRPYNGQSHLTQREEYLGLPTVTGLYSLDPSDPASLLLLHHSPSGAFSPIVDSAGRVVFTNWDHLARDPEAVTDSRPPATGAPYNETFTQTSNGSGNFTDESAGASFTQVTAMAPNSWDIFPEPRNFDRKLLVDGFGGTLNGSAQNIFLPWMIRLDGTGGEVLNHVGRQEIAQLVQRSFTNDANLVDLLATSNPGYGGMTIRTFLGGGLMWPREDPLKPGTFYGSDAADLGTHGAGQVVRLNNAGAKADGSSLNPDGITITYITSGANGNSKPGFIPTVKPSINLPPTGQSPLSAANAETLYRTPVPLGDGNLIASQAANVTQADYNAGTVAQPVSLFTFRLKSLKVSGNSYIADITLTPGINLNTTYWSGATQVTYNGPAWELDPVEIAPRNVPMPAPAQSLDPVEAGVFAMAGVHVPTFQRYLQSNNAALAVTRDVTRRDLHDRQQPYNVRVAWSGKQAVGKAGTIYDVAWMQFLQADLRRGYLMGGASPAPGRRVVATPLHDTMAENVVDANAPPGSVRVGDDGSVAAILPAGKGMTWHLLGNDANKTSYIKERFWVTFQKGEIRTCTNCHGINTSDQTGTVASPVPAPTNAPQALAALLTQWKSKHPAGAVAFTTAAASALKTTAIVTLTVSRSGGSTGPVAVDYSTVDGTALAGTDYSATSGTLNWADGDLADKTVMVPLIGNAPPGKRTFSVSLKNPTYATLGAVPTALVDVVDVAMPDMAIAQIDLAGAPADMTLTTADMAMMPADMIMLSDMIMPVDLAASPDLASPSDSSASPDLVSAVDSSEIRDLASPPDLASANAPDLAVAPTTDAGTGMPSAPASGCSVARSSRGNRPTAFALSTIFIGWGLRRRKQRQGR